MKHSLLAFALLVAAAPAYPVENGGPSEVKQQLPRMIVVKVKVTGKEGQEREENPEVCEMQTQQRQVKDAASAKQVADQCATQEAFRITDDKEKLPEQLQTALDATSSVADQALDGNFGLGRWVWGIARGAGRFLYGHGFRGYYGYGSYLPWAYPTYGYYYGGYRYPYSYSYSYPYGGYRYHFYHNPYYRW